MIAEQLRHRVLSSTIKVPRLQVRAFVFTQMTKLRHDINWAGKTGRPKHRVNHQFKTELITSFLKTCPAPLFSSLGKDVNTLTIPGTRSLGAALDPVALPAVSHCLPGHSCQMSSRSRTCLLLPHNCSSSVS